ncbi:MAG: SusF/SusE family outer membrane protein, partial [Cyclobacteriaceae bacterium]|nr:SusF/SusE family outer membrane protein [Cyclobacteriaceae bacterium]
QLSEIVYDQITSVGAIGTATPTGWGGDTEMTTTITADGLTAVAEGVTLDEDVMKFRFNCRWAIDRRLDTGKDFANDNGYSFWTNFGGQSFDNLVAGNRSDGGNLPVPEYAVYTINFAWTAADGFTASITKTGEAEPKPEYPEVMYLVGAGTAYGWDEPGTHDAAVMHTVANSKDGLFWKILYIEAGQGFKISAAAWGSPNLGFADPDSYDAEGVTVSDKDGNMDIATSGMYEVVLDLRNDETKVSIRPAVVYGIGGDGSAFNTGWASMDAATKFTVDDVAKTIYSPAIAADGTIRTYASHPWVTNADDGDWWTSEFVPNAGAIEYRNNSGNDPSSISATAGDVITYTFDDNTASID